MNGLLRRERPGFAWAFPLINPAKSRFLLFAVFI
jgi:hypothetical protein